MDITFDVEYKIIEEKSKFISYIIFNFSRVDQISEIINYLKCKHKKAKHICFAYKCNINNIEYKKYFDDGEPFGSAGKPILSVIENFNLENTLVLVVRYFGGKKLGYSRLLKTYRKCVRESINNYIKFN